MKSKILIVSIVTIILVLVVLLLLRSNPASAQTTRESWVMSSGDSVTADEGEWVDHPFRVAVQGISAPAGQVCFSGLSSFESEGYFFSGLDSSGCITREWTYSSGQGLVYADVTLMGNSVDDNVVEADRRLSLVLIAGSDTSPVNNRDSLALTIQEDDINTIYTSYKRGEIWGNVGRQVVGGYRLRVSHYGPAWVDGNGNALPDGHRLTSILITSKYRNEFIVSHGGVQRLGWTALAVLHGLR